MLGSRGGFYLRETRATRGTELPVRLIRRRRAHLEQLRDTIRVVASIEILKD